MKHKFSGMPSKGWIQSYLRPYMDRWITFEIDPKSDWYRLLVEEGAFKKDAPIYASGVLIGIFKKPKTSFGSYGFTTHGEIGINLLFAKISFHQGNSFARNPMARSHRDHKTQITEFGLSEIRGCALAEKLRVSVPGIGHTPERIS